MADAGPKPIAAELDRNALAQRAGKLQRIPVGQADAAVRLGLADLAGLRSAVNSEPLR